MTKKITVAFLLLTSLCGALLAAEPPDIINYQGVLRGASDEPLDGDQNFVFRFWSAEVGGDEILIDEHTALNGNPVTASGGLFSVELGGGLVSDGSGPGTYASLADVFRDHAAVYLAVEIGGEILSPRVRIVAAAYALNASHLDGVDSTQMMRSDTSDAFTSGTLTLDAGTVLDVDGALQMDGPVSKATTDLVANLNADLLDGNDSSAFAAAVHGHTGGEITGPVAEADTLDGRHASDFVDTSSTAQTKSGTLTVDAGSIASSAGVTGLGTDRGGYFSDSDSSGHAYVGDGDYGIRAFGNEMGGYFGDADGSGYARVGFADWGVRGFGNGGGGYFEDLDASGFANVGYGNRGIEAFGNVLGGKFGDLDQSGVAHVGFGDRGIEAFGNEMGGYFEDADGDGYAYVGYLNYGIQGFGLTGGGYFTDNDGSGYGYIGAGDYGVWGGGDTAGGYFLDTNSSGYAYVGYGDNGIEARGSYSGGYFSPVDDSSYAYVGRQYYGFYGGGIGAGGRFEDTNSAAYAYVAWDTRKISGTGSVNFVQNHPYQKDQVIVYAAPEGDEVATYTRGTARLIDGEARVRLGETFKWVTNPDIGLTAWVTPIGDWSDLYVAEKSTTELVVRSRAGAPDVTFDFIVYGLRIGFEEVTVVQEKEQESFIPSMSSHRERYERRPEYRQFNALERFKRMQTDVSGTDAKAIDLSASLALRNAIHEYDPSTDPAVYELFGHEPPAEKADRPAPAEGSSQADEPSVPSETPDGPDAPARVLVEERRSRESGPAESIEPSLPDNLLPVAESVEPGDLLVLDPERRGWLRRGVSIADPAVVGIVAGDPSEVDGKLQAPVALFGLATVKADAGYGVILAGDLLTTSPTPGHAMIAIAPPPGTVVGKALEPLEVGTGLIKVLVMPR